MINFVPSNQVMEKEDKRANILEAAERLFMELGYEGTSTRQIAKEAGANMSMINYYFGSKEGVFMEIMSDRVKVFRTVIESVSQDNLTAMQKLLKVMEGYARKILCNPGLHKMMHRELSLSQRPEMFSTIKNAMAENIAVIEKIIREGIEEGQFRPAVDIRMLIATIMGTISYVTNSPAKITSGTSLDINKPEDRDAITERMISHLQDLIITYLTPKK